MTDAYLMDADCVHGNYWAECKECERDPNHQVPARTDLQITWHPGYAFGEPTICSSAVKAESVATLIWAGDSVEEVADDYGLTVEQVRLACWWWRRQAKWSREFYAKDQVAGRARFQAWDRWADTWLSWAGGHTPVDPGDPPGASK